MDGKVRRLNADNFDHLVSRYLNVPVAFPLSRRDFWDLSPKERDQRKDGAFITSCAFQYEIEGRRCDESSTSLVLAILDLDEGEFVKELAEFPDTISEALYPFNHAVWHTAKSKPDAPRLKIMVEVSPCHPVHLRRIISFIAFRLGIPKNFKGVKESSTVSQAQYRPIQFRGEEFTSVIASKTDGIPLSPSDVPENDPDADEKLNGRTYACDPSESEDEYYGLAYLPVQDLRLEDVTEALDAIDPDCNRPTWVQIAASLRHQFTDEDEARAAYEKFDEWSSKGTKFEGRKDTWNTWRSLRPYARGRAPVTIRTLFKYAQDAGWDNSKAARKIAKSVEEWFQSCQSREELMIEGATRIAGMVFKNSVVEESLVIAWRKRLMALGETIDKTTLKKEITKVRKADKKAKQDARGDNLPSWLRPFVYVATLDAFVNLGNGVALRPGAFDRFFAKELMPKDETPANGLPIMQPVPYALNIHKILRVEETLYDPTRKEDDKLFTDEETGKLILNTYNHNSVPVADPEFKDAAERLFRQLLKPLVREPEILELLIDYLAMQVQFPGIKVPWAFLIQSAPGVGKGTLGEVMEAVLGPVNVKIVSPEMMKATFNDWARNCVFGIFNEVHMPGDRRDQIMNSIKPLISDPTIAVNIKHQDAECRVKNFTNYIAFTNYKDAAHIAEGDRRWCIVFSPIQTKAQAEALNASGHFDQVRWLTTPEGASALRYFLLKRKISENFPAKGHAPMTKYREEVVEQSKNSLQIAIEDAIDDQIDPLIGPEVIHEGRLRERVCRGPKDPAFLTRYLALIGYERHNSARVMIDGTRGSIWTHSERWTNGADPVNYLKKRLKETPELDEDEDFEFS